MDNEYHGARSIEFDEPVVRMHWQTFNLVIASVSAQHDSA